MANGKRSKRIRSRGAWAGHEAPLEPSVRFRTGAKISSNILEWSGGVEGIQPTDPEFLALLQLLRGLQQAKLIETATTRQADHVEIGLRFHPADPSRTAEAEQVGELKELLGVPAVQNRVKIVFGNFAPGLEVIGFPPTERPRMIRHPGWARNPDLVMKYLDSKHQTTHTLRHSNYEA